MHVFGTKGFCVFCNQLFDGGISMRGDVPFFVVYHLDAYPFPFEEGKFLMDDTGVHNAEEMNKRRECLDQGKLFGVPLFALQHVEVIPVLSVEVKGRGQDHS